MKKVNLNFALKDLDGNEVENSNAGKIVAQVLQSSTKGDALKNWEWAVGLHTNGELDLDSSDFETLKTFVKTHEQLPSITKAQVLLRLI